MFNWLRRRGSTSAPVYQPPPLSSNASPIERLLDSAVNDRASQLTQQLKTLILTTAMAVLGEDLLTLQPALVLLNVYQFSLKRVWI
eukprot:m.207381 g.207381  ORF g.207381 m.207381 type:complete len:86 (-) comp17122_c0_seq25:3087-3344(-)